MRYTYEREVTGSTKIQVLVVGAGPVGLVAA
jgi:threonine dehydrogenase-like Zn-dependent dehydrogenase